VISRRSAVIGLLVSVPVVIYGVLGGLALWETGLLRRSWWVAPLFWVAAWLLGQFWKTGHPMRQAHTVPIPPHWTPRDEQADDCRAARNHAWVSAIVVFQSATPLPNCSL